MLFSSSKDGSIIKWDMITGKRVSTCPKLRKPSSQGNGKGKGRAETVEGHTDEILSIAVSSDGRWLVSGGKDRKVVVWDARQMKWVKTFTGHKDGVTVSPPPPVASSTLISLTLFVVVRILHSRSSSARTPISSSRHPLTARSSCSTCRPRSLGTWRRSLDTKTISYRSMRYEAKRPSRLGRETRR